MEYQTFAAMDAKKKGSGLTEKTSDGESVRRAKFENPHGLHWIITGLFIVGDMAGGGLVAVPTAIIQSRES
uniref:Aa_trans domain-containing protein n=1 Tax=Steinernema glaseri TaxID=37863 RepID=A0A1I7Z3X6_9BILA